MVFRFLRVRHMIKFVFLGAIILSGSTAYAQLGMPGFDHAVTLLLSPNQPEPGETVGISAESPIVDLTRSTLEWRADGKIIGSAVGLTHITVTAGPLGSVTTVSLSVAGPDGSILKTSTDITPARIDLIYDSNSYIPPFYRGRALPSAGTTVRVVAIPHFTGVARTEPAPSDVSYVWKRNGRILSNLSGYGAGNIRVPAPALYSSDTLSVDATTRDGRGSAHVDMTVPSVTPFLLLYEDHPLFGITMFHALQKNEVIPDTEMTFAAEPYFADARNADDHVLTYTWRVNNELVTSTSSEQSKLTISGGKTGGDAQIALSLNHLTNIFLNLTDSWHVTLRGGAEGLSGDQGKSPFEAPKK